MKKITSFKHIFGTDAVGVKEMIKNGTLDDMLTIQERLRGRWERKMNKDKDEYLEMINEYKKKINYLTDKKKVETPNWENLYLELYEIVSDLLFDVCFYYHDMKPSYYISPFETDSKYFEKRALKEIQNFIEKSNKTK